MLGSVRGTEARRRMRNVMLDLMDGTGHHVEKGYIVARQRQVYIAQALFDRS